MSRPDQDPSETIADTPNTDVVQEADEESFPASDAPAHTVVTGIRDRPLEPDDDNRSES